MDYLAFSLLMLAAQFSPGPDMLLLIRNALAHAPRAGLFTVLGIAAGLCLHLTAVLTGLALAVKESPWLFPSLLLAGGAWLIWLGIQLLRTRLSLAGAEEPAASPAGAGLAETWIPLGDAAAFLQGFVTNLTNAKAILFLTTVVMAWIGPNPGWERKAAAAAIILGQALVFWSLFVMALQHPLVRRGWHRTAQPLHLIFGSGLILLGLHAAREAVILLSK